MSEPYRISASPVFRLTLRKLLAFVAKKHGDEVAIETRSTLKSRVDTLKENPALAPISDRLAEFGFHDYRQLTVGKHNLIFYRIDEQKHEIVLVVAMDARQSVEQLLYEVTIES